MSLKSFAQRLGVLLLGVTQTTAISAFKHPYVVVVLVSILSIVEYMMIVVYSNITEAYEKEKEEQWKKRLF